MRRLVAGLLLVVAFVLAACGSQADTVSKNLSKEAEKFNVVRSIVGINGITDKVEFEVRGRCSVEGETWGGLKVLVAICKDTVNGHNKYSKHVVGISDNMTFVVTQLEGINVSEFRTKIILKPQGLVPDLDLVTG